MDEAAFHELISGQRRGFVPAVQRAGLSALSVFYGLGVRARNRAFDLGWKKTHRADVPVISIGNITTGGTGKTPLVAYLANWFQHRGVNVALLSRGYRSLDDGASGGRQPAGHDDQSHPGAHTPGSPGNDEKRVLDQLCPGVPHLQNPDRVGSAKRAVNEFGAELLILDDGFQHRRIRRDLDVVLVDALNPFGYGRLLPRGLLREPLSELSRADLIVLTRADQCTADEKMRILNTVRGIVPEVPMVEVAFHPGGVLNATDESDTLDALKGKPLVAFCGIGNPESFRRTLAGCDVREFRVFPDHHHYSTADVEQIADDARKHGATAIVATLKDLVKIEQPAIGTFPFWAVNITATILSGNEILQDRLARLATQTQSGRSA